MGNISTALVLVFALDTSIFSSNDTGLSNTDKEERANNPVRRAPAMNPAADQLALKSGDFAEKLITMLACYHRGEYNITKQKILNYINQNPDNANPYSARYDAHLITLASRWGFLGIVRAIAENNQSSIGCQSNGGQLDKDDMFTCYGRYTPLDEAVAFGQKNVAKYLFRLGAPLFTVARGDLHRLIDKPSKKRKVIS